MSINGMPDHRLDEIELRLIGCDHRPWRFSSHGQCDDEGRRVVKKGSLRATRRAEMLGRTKAINDGAKTHSHSGGEIIPSEKSFDMNTIGDFLTLFKRTEHATNDMMEFVAHAPDDVEDLLREVRSLRTMLKVYKEKSETAIKELQASKIAATRAETRIVDMRRAWRTLVKEMGTKP